MIMFCARQQRDTTHELDIDGNGEIVLTCTENVGTEKEPEICGRFVKLPAGTDAEGVKAYVAAHKESNQGQVSVEAAEAKKAQLLADLNKEPAE